MIRKRVASPRLPRSICCGGEELAVREADLQGKLGFFDTRTGEITIKRRQPAVGKQLILLHELIHLSAELLKQSGLIRRQPDEAFVTNAAATLFPLLAMSGLWAGVTKAQAQRFCERHLRNRD